MERAYITTKNESVRMFESEFMEFCSHVHPIVPLVIYLPFILAALCRVLAKTIVELRGDGAFLSRNGDVDAI